MYRNIITLKDCIAEKTKQNVVEELKRIHSYPQEYITYKESGYKLIFETVGDDDKSFMEMQIAIGKAYIHFNLAEYIESWEYEDDEDPEENGDVLEQMSKL